MKEWTDEKTGRRIRQLTALPGGAYLDYFRFPRQLPGGLLLAIGKTDKGNLLALEPESGEARALPITMAGFIKLRESDGRLWYLASGEREIWAANLPDGTPARVATIPASVPGTIRDITCDGQTVILTEVTQDLKDYPIPVTKDVKTFWHYISRPRSVKLSSFHLPSAKVTPMASSGTLVFDHIETSPVDPGLVRYCQDMFDGLGQRVWSVRVDGSDQKPIRPQESGEVVTHEFWWPGAKHIGYTYLDRRGDDTLHDLPWSEYAPRPTQLGIADLRGKEVYLSDPLNSYHTHLYTSPDGAWVCGEGTDGNSFVFAAPFSSKNARINFTALATVHTPYVPFRGQMVNCGFSADNRWLLYNDTIDGVLQVCAVKVAT